MTVTSRAAPAEAIRPLPRRPAPWWALTVLVVLGLQFLAVGLHEAQRDAPAVDEVVDVSSGVTSLVRHDLRLEPEHGMLPKLVAAVPALLAHPVVPHTEA